MTQIRLQITLKEIKTELHIDFWLKYCIKYNSINTKILKAFIISTLKLTKLIKSQVYALYNFAKVASTFGHSLCKHKPLICYVFWNVQVFDETPWAILFYKRVSLLAVRCYWQQANLGPKEPIMPAVDFIRWKADHSCTLIAWLVGKLSVCEPSQTRQQVIGYPYHLKACLSVDSVQLIQWS